MLRPSCSRHLFNENCCGLIPVSLTFAFKWPINKKPTVFHTMTRLRKAWMNLNWDLTVLFWELLSYSLDTKRGWLSRDRWALNGNGGNSRSLYIQGQPVLIAKWFIVKCSHVIYITHVVVVRKWTLYHCMPTMTLRINRFYGDDVPPWMYFSVWNITWIYFDISIHCMEKSIPSRDVAVN